MDQKPTNDPFIKRFRRVIRQLLDDLMVHIYDIDPSQFENEVGTSHYR